MKQKQPTPNSKSEDALVFDGLTVRYGSVLAIESITGAVQRNSLLAVVGPNGGGKSTLLKAILKLVKPSAGRLRLHPKGLRIAYLPQKAAIDQTFPMTVAELVASGLIQTVGFFKPIQDHSLTQIKEALQDVGLEEFWDRPLSALSGGQFQRVLFARLAVQGADMLLLDEPFTALDVETIDVLIETLRRWHDQGKTVLVVSHDLDLVQEYFPETLLVSRRVVHWGPTKDVLTLDNLREAKRMARLS